MLLQIDPGKIKFKQCHFLCFKLLMPSYFRLVLRRSNSFHAISYVSNFSCHITSGWNWQDQISAMPFLTFQTSHAMPLQVSPGNNKSLPCHFLCLKLLMPCHFRLILGKIKFKPCYFLCLNFLMPCHFRLVSCHAISYVSYFSCQTERKKREKKKKTDRCYGCG